MSNSHPCEMQGLRSEWRLCRRRDRISALFSLYALVVRITKIDWEFIHRNKIPKLASCKTDDLTRDVFLAVEKF
jgi:hypothetical protein